MFPDFYEFYELKIINLKRLKIIKKIVRVAGGVGVAADRAGAEVGGLVRVHLLGMPMRVCARR
jgi:hypothetical protein